MDDSDIMQRGRDRKVVEIVYNFLLATLTFHQQYEKYKQRNLRFSDLVKLVDDQGKSILYILKESCQDLFRRNDAHVSEKEQLFDLTIGSIFHLAMKMREDLYQLEVYGPKYLALSKRDDSHPGQEYLIQQFQDILSRAETSFKEGIEEIAVLSQDIAQQFKEFLGEHRQNGLLIRFILEEKDLCKEVLGEDSVEDIFRILYGADLAQGYRLSGESYFQSAFYSQAIKVFSRALELMPEDESIQFKIHLCQGMEQFYSFAPLQALKSFEKCLSFCRKEKLPGTHRDMIRKVCQKIQEELPGRRKGDPHRDLIKKAKVILRQLEERPPVHSETLPA